MRKHTYVVDSFDAKVVGQRVQCLNCHAGRVLESGVTTRPDLIGVEICPKCRWKWPADKLRLTEDVTSDHIFKRTEFLSANDKVMWTDVEGECYICHQFPCEHSAGFLGWNDDDSKIIEFVNVWAAYWGSDMAKRQTVETHLAKAGMVDVHAKVDALIDQGRLVLIPKPRGDYLLVPKFGLVK